MGKITRDELIKIIDDLNTMLVKTREDLASAQRELDWMRGKLIEAQATNRKLDWLLTKVVEQR